MGLEMGIPIFGKLFAAMKQGKLANEINPQDTTYTENPYAKQNLGAVYNLFNARVPGAAEAGQRILNTQSNQIENIQRNATDSSTALAMGLASQGVADEASQKLMMSEGQQKYGLLDNLSNAYRMLISEGDKVYQDKVRRYNNEAASKAVLRESELKNYAGFGSDLTSAAIMAATGGMGGGMGSTLGMAGGLGKTGGLPVTGYNSNQLF